MSSLDQDVTQQLLKEETWIYDSFIEGLITQDTLSIIIINILI